MFDSLLFKISFGIYPITLSENIDDLVRVANADSKARTSVRAVKSDNDVLTLLCSAYLYNNGPADSYFSEVTKQRTSGVVTIDSFFRPPMVFPGFFDFFSIRRRQSPFSKYQSDMDVYNSKVIAFNSKVKDYTLENLKQTGEIVRNIRIYQGGIDEVSKSLGRRLEIVDTKKQETFLEEKNSFDLRIAAYLLGANAIVHYQHESNIGTPVKFASSN